MGDWVSKKLVDVCVLQRGFDLPKRERKSGQFPLISSSGVIDYHAEAKVKGPGVVTGRSGSIGQVFHIEEDFWPLNTALYIKEFHGNEPRFTSYLLQYFDLNKYTSGAGVPTLNRNHVHNETVLVPTSITEQKRIVALLDNVFADLEQTRAKTEQNLKNARELFDSYLQQVFSQKGDGWVDNKIGSICDFQNGFAFKSKDTVDTSNTQLIRMGNLYQNILSLERKPAFYPDSFYDDHQRYHLYQGDLIISLTGTVDKEDYGYTVEIPKTDRNLLLNQRIAKFTNIDTALINKRFFLRFLRSRIFLDKLYATARGTRQANLSTVTMNEMSISYPSMEKQEELVSLIDGLEKNVFSLEENYQKKLNNIDELKKSILQKAFSGELTNAVE